MGLERVEQGLVVGIDRPQAVAEEVQLVLHPDGGGEHRGVLAKRAGLRRAAREEASGRGLAPRRVGVAVPLLGAASGRRPIEAAHRRLHRDARGLVERAEDDRRQRAVDLLVDDADEQRPASPRAVCGGADVVEGPSLLIEAHLERRRGTEGAAEQDLVAARHLGVVGVGLTRPVIAGSGDLVGSPVVAHEEAEREGLAVDLFVAAHEFGGSEHVGEALRLLKRQHPQREAAPGRDPLALATETVEERSRHHVEEVGLGLAAARGEPERVDDLAWAVRRIVGDGGDIGEHEAELERSPAPMGHGG